MEIGLQIKIIYQDTDLDEARVSAWNGAFGGVGDVYLNKGDLAELAGRLHGFPNSPEDARDFTLGAFDPESAGGGVEMKFRCIGSTGHACVEAKIESSDDSVGTSQCVTLSLPIEPSAVDSFVADLGGLTKGGVGSVASLKAIVPEDR